VYEGNYTRYRTLNAQALQRAQAQPASEAPAAPAATGATTPTRLRAGKTGKRGDVVASRTVEQVEREITQREERMASLEADLASASAAADLARIGELGAAYEREKSQLDALYAEWQDLAS
ncbi:MAG TPA: ABC transporter C-terminal domain-containing protein, partial [Ktedonobacterales bacterium]